MKPILLILINLVFITLFSCQNDKETSLKKEEELSFAIDNNLLGTTIRDINTSLAYSVPKLWLITDSSYFSNIFESINYEKKNLNLCLRPINLFLDTNSKSFLVVSELTSEFYNLNIKMLDNEITDILKNKFDSLTTKKAMFYKDGIEILQYLLMLKDAVNFKLIFAAKNFKYIQFDYFLSRETYMNEIKAVESSIGSIVYF